MRNNAKAKNWGFNCRRFSALEGGTPPGKDESQWLARFYRQIKQHSRGGQLRPAGGLAPREGEQEGPPAKGGGVGDIYFNQPRSLAVFCWQRGEKRGGEGDTIVVRRCAPVAGVAGLGSLRGGSTLVGDNAVHHVVHHSCRMLLLDNVRWKRRLMKRTIVQ